MIRKRKLKLKYLLMWYSTLRMYSYDNIGLIKG
jgi:hypothetical protein